MAKVTIVFEDNHNGMSVHANFDQPGVPFKEMKANPTFAVTAGFASLKIAELLSCRVEGNAKDDDGSNLAIGEVLSALNGGGMA